MSIRAFLPCLSLPLLLPASCGGEPAPVGPAIEEQGAPESSEGPSGGTEAAVDDGVALTEAVTLRGGLRVRAPEAWEVEETSSSMRAAQYRLADPAEGGGADAALVVYYFGPAGGGTVAMNMDRWRGQFEGPDGGPATDAVESANEVNGLQVSELNIRGTYVAETMPGSGELRNEPDWRMRAVVVETPNGAFFLKLTGPAATVDAWADSFDAYVASIEY